MTPWKRVGTSVYETDKLGFVDFNGDGKTDVFVGTGSEWKVSWSGAASWQTINTSEFTVDKLAFGDFNGDGETDVIWEFAF